MHNKLSRLGALLLLPLILLCFWSGYTELWKIYTSFWLFDNAVAAIGILLLYAVMAWKYGLKQSDIQENRPGLLILIGIVLCSIGLLVNNFLSGFSILPPILAIVISYMWLGFWIDSAFWKRSFIICLLLILTLPVLERLQKFIGFPLRLFTAQIVSILLELVGAGNISQSTVISTENYATTIDLPCSGVKSIYFGGVLFLCVSFLQQLRLSIRTIALAGTFFFLLLFFNIWRVFGLVYVYGVLNFIEAGDSIHLLLGIVGFMISCVFLWYGSEYISRLEPKNQKLNQTKSFKLNTFFTQYKIVACSSLVLIITTLLTQTILKLPSKASTAALQNIPFSVPSMVTSVIPFSDKEYTLFVDSDVTFASKYLLQSNDSEMSLLLVKSHSARSHHDPELCLQGLGYQLVNHETVTVYDDQIQKIDIQASQNGIHQKGIVYYWYVSSDRVIMDYSQRVWEQFQQKDQEWVLIELVFEESQSPDQADLEHLFTILNAAVRKQLL